MVRVPHFLLVLILAEIVSSFVFNDTLIDDNEIKFKEVETRRQGRRKSKSTSSSEVRKADGKSINDESLEQVFTDLSTSDSAENKYGKKDRTPKSTAERTGWRKWHRKCTKCPEDMRKKWRDPSIKWVCGAYQRARRTFKSLCMMHYRNCQDGTMFTKISDHRCPDGSGLIRPYNLHFFYDYAVRLSDDSTDSEASSSDVESPSSSSWDTSRIATLPP